MNVLEEQTVTCPYCGEAISVLVDCSVEDQDYVEDCQVCCCPIVFSAHVDDERVEIRARREND